MSDSIDLASFSKAIVERRKEDRDESDTIIVDQALVDFVQKDACAICKAKFLLSSCVAPIFFASGHSKISYLSSKNGFTQTKTFFYANLFPIAVMQSVK